MQSHMSSAPLPNPMGGAVPIRRPEIVAKPAPPQRRRPRMVGWIAALVAVALATGVYFNRERLSSKKDGVGSVTGLTTTSIVIGDLQRTVRLSGTISAERFAALMAPQLRGSRSGGGMNPGQRGFWGPQCYCQRAPQRGIVHAARRPKSWVLSLPSTGSSSSSSCSWSSALGGLPALARAWVKVFASSKRD